MIKDSKFFLILCAGAIIFLGGRAAPESAFAGRGANPPLPSGKKNPGSAPALTKAPEDPVEVRHDADLTVPPGDTLKVCTYNIQNLMDGINDPFRTQLITKRQVNGAAGILGEIDADIVFLQEIENKIILDRLNKLLPKPYPIAYISNFGMARNRPKINVAFFSRIPVEVRELEFGQWGDKAKPPRGALRAEFKLDDRTRLLGYGVHLKSNHGEYEENVAKRVAGLRIIKDDAAKLAAANPGLVYESFVIGDFNTDPDAERFAKDPTLGVLEGWSDLWRGTPLKERTTLDERQGDPELTYPPICFDRIVVSPALTSAPWRASKPMVVRRGVDVKNVYVHPGQTDEHVSDHYPVYLELHK